MMYISMNTKIKLKGSEFSIAETRRNLPSLVREAENGRTVRLTRRGKPVALLIGQREFERLVPDFLNTLTY